MEENKRTDSGYTGEYGNPVEHNDAPQVETENAAAYSETAQSASEQGASAQAEQSSTYSYSYKNGEGTSTHSGDYYGGGAAQPNNESAQQSGAGSTANEWLRFTDERWPTADERRSTDEFQTAEPKTTESKEIKTAGQRKYRKENCILHCMCRYLWCCFRNMFPRRSLCNESLPAYDNIIYHEIAVNNRR